MLIENKHVCPTFDFTRQAWQLAFRRRMDTSLPRGPQTAGSVGPNRATVGVPHMAARWVTPESFPMYPEACWRTVERTGRGTDSNIFLEIVLSWERSSSRLFKSAGPESHKTSPLFDKC